MQMTNAEAEVKARELAAQEGRVWTALTAAERIELTDRVRGATPDPEALELAEAARRYYERIAFNDDVAISSGSSKPYLNAKAAFLAAIRAAYPALPLPQIYGVWLNCNESVEYCASFVRAYPEDAELRAEPCAIV